MIAPFDVMPSSGVPVSSVSATVGAAGAVASTGTVTGAEAGLSGPSPTRARAVIVWTPSAGTPSKVTLHAPLSSTVPVAVSPPSVTTTADSGRPVPDTSTPAAASAAFTALGQSVTTGRRGTLSAIAVPTSTGWSFVTASTIVP